MDSLVSTCSNCEGRGWEMNARMPRPEIIDCRVCLGRGVELTEDGRQMIQFLKTFTPWINKS